MARITFTHLDGYPVVVKRYRFEETPRFKCIGSGARNEGLLPPSLGDLAPKLLAYCEDTEAEVAVLEQRHGLKLLADAIGSREATLAGETLGHIHSIQGAYFGSLDGHYRFDSEAEAFIPRWRVAMDLLGEVDGALARATDEWAAPQMRYMTRSISPRLVHGDFGPANLLWLDEHRLVAVLDWEHARYGDPMEDWAKILLACEFPEPNGFGNDSVVLGALVNGWLRFSGISQLSQDPVMDLYKAYFAATLGVFFGKAGEARLEWLVSQIDKGY